MTTVAFSMGKGFRNDQSMNKTQQENPGPGTYAPDAEKNTKYTNNPSYGVGTAKRSEMANSA